MAVSSAACVRWMLRGAYVVVEAARQVDALGSPCEVRVPPNRMVWVPSPNSNNYYKTTLKSIEDSKAPPYGPMAM